MNKKKKIHESVWEGKRREKEKGGRERRRKRLICYRRMPANI